MGLRITKTANVFLLINIHSLLKLIRHNFTIYFDFKKCVTVFSYGPSSIKENKFEGNFFHSCFFYKLNLEDQNGIFGSFKAFI